ncbi:MAG: hypothetical protein GC180_00465 [Bacteroidetes bacterium]|nr:hypothetical protein [Bacteroidota bacterium]
MKNVKIYLILLLMGLISCAKDGNMQSASSGDESGLTGTGGSTARFTLKGDYLYTVNSQSLKAFDLGNPAQPIMRTETFLGVDIETIFPNDNFLLIGSQSGMYIYDISQAAHPARVGFYEHVVSCDPVVAQGNFAYVTLRTVGNGRCSRGINAFEIIDISDPSAPELVASRPMNAPRGLGVGDIASVFVCEDGLVHLDVSDVHNIHELGHYNTASITQDVIPTGDNLILIADDGLYQYKENNGSLDLLSKIPVE